MSIKNIVTGQLSKVTTYTVDGQVDGVSTTGDITTTANLSVAGISELGDIGNIVITGGSAGEVLSTDGTGNLSWTPNPIYTVPAVYIKSPFAGNNQSFSNTILASYNSNTEMTVFYNGVLLENTYYTLIGDTITVNIPLQIDDTIDIVTTVSANVNSIVSSGYGNSNVAAYLPLYTGALANLAGDVTTTANVTAAKVSLGTGNLQLTGNTVSSAADIITIDPLGDGTPSGNVVVAGNLQVAGTLTYNNIVNATTNDLQWIAANNAVNQSAATGSGLSVGPAGAYASFTYNSGSNVWQSSLPLIANGGVNANGALSGATTGSFSGNVTASYFIGNGSQLTGLPESYTNSNVSTYLASNANVVITTTGNITTTANVISGNISTGKLNVSGTSNLGPVGNITITGGSPGRALTTNGSGVLTWTTVVDPGTIPAFSVVSAGGSINVAVAYALYQVPFATEELDTDNWYSTATNRYTPQLAGWYQINAVARPYTGNVAGETAVVIRKNGVQIAASEASGLITGSVSRLVYCNGTTDYIDVALFNSLPGTATQNFDTVFNGFWVRP